jgi:hypothetical protein
MEAKYLRAKRVRWCRRFPDIPILSGISGIVKRFGIGDEIRAVI